MSQGGWGIYLRANIDTIASPCAALIYWLFLQEAKKAQPLVGKINTTPAEEVKPTPKNEPLVFAKKQVGICWEE